MVAAVSHENSAPGTTPPEPTHWLDGRYFVPLPDLSDETRKAIYAGHAAAAWLEILARLRGLERRGPDESRQAAAAGRIEGLGVNGLAAAVGCSPTTALKHLRHLEALGLIRTEQGEFTLEADPVTGKFKRNYAKAPPKVIIVTIEDRHCRPCRASGTRRAGTPESGPRAAGGTPESGGKASDPRARNWCVSKERTSKEVRSFGTNKRRTAAGPGKGPAAAAAAEKGQRPAMPAEPADAWGEEQARRRAKERQIEVLANGLQIPAIEVIALMRGNPDELRRIATEAGILTPEGQFARHLGSRHLARRIGWQPPTVSAETQQAIRAGIEELRDPRRLTPEQAEILANVTKATRHCRGSLVVPAEFIKASERIMEIRERAEASGRPEDLKQAEEEGMKILREYAEAGKAVA